MFSIYMLLFKMGTGQRHIVLVLVGLVVSVVVLGVQSAPVNDNIG